MRHLHALVMARQVIYLGVSDTPAWVVVKANECKVRLCSVAVSILISATVARRNGLTPFSLYQGRWNAAFRDMESEIIPMCEDQGIAIVSWASLGGGQLVSTEQREKLENDPTVGKGFYKASEDDIKVCKVLEGIASSKKATLQDIVSLIGTYVGSVLTCSRHWRISSTNRPMSSPSSVCKQWITSSSFLLPWEFRSRKRKSTRSMARPTSTPYFPTLSSSATSSTTHD